MSKTKKTKKTPKPAKKTNLNKTREYTDYLLELHKLQGVLLSDLKKSLHDNP